MTNAQRREIINSAKASGYQGSYVDLFRQAEISPDAYVASTPEQYQDGLRTQHAAGNTDASMAFPNVPPNTPFNTHGMKVPIDIKKYDEQGHLVKSYESVPPGVDAINTGPSQGTVIETPSERLQEGGYKAQGGLFFNAYPSEEEQVSPEMKAALAETGLADNPILKQQAANPIATPSPQKSISQESVNYEGPKTSMLEMAANPLKTARYVNEHGLQRPTTAEWDNTTGNAMDTAIGVVNPASWVQSGIDAVGAAKEGNYGEAGLHALGAVPGLKAVGSTSKFAKMVPAYMPKTFNLMKGLPASVTKPYHPIGRGIRTVNYTQARVSNVATNATNMFMQSAPMQSFMGTGAGQTMKKGVDLMSQGVATTKKPGQAVMNWAADTRPGRVISGTLNTPVKALGGETLKDGLSAYGTTWAVANAPSVTEKLMEGDVGGAASHMSKLPVGKGLNSIIGGARRINDLASAGEGVYDIATGKGDRWDVAGLSKLLPGTSQFRIGLGLETALEEDIKGSRRNGGLTDRRGVLYSNRRYKR